MNYSKALYVAQQAHGKQVDKAGVLYILHPIAVSNLVKSKTAKIVALLHDVVEDTKTTLKDLKRHGFSKKIVDAVDAITHRKGESRVDYLTRVKKNPIALEVKFADLAHNMSKKRMKNLPPDMQARLMKKYEENLNFLLGKG